MHLKISTTKAMDKVSSKREKKNWRILLLSQGLRLNEQKLELSSVMR